MRLKNRISRLEQRSPNAANQPIYVVAGVGETLEEAKARVFAERGIADGTDAHVIYVTWGRAEDIPADSR